jgi:hypothetical protein
MYKSAKRYWKPHIKEKMQEMGYYFNIKKKITKLGKNALII